MSSAVSKPEPVFIAGEHDVMLGMLCACANVKKLENYRNHETDVQHSLNNPGSYLTNGMNGGRSV